MSNKKVHVLILNLIILPASLIFSSLQTVIASPSATVNQFQPISSKACKTLQAQIARSIKKRSQQVSLITSAKFEDQITKAKGTACQLTASGTGKEFKNIADLATSVTSGLTNLGWKEDQKYAADSPEGKLLGFRKGKELAVLEVQSSLAKSVKCPQNSPVDSCYQRAKPEQIIYKITLNILRNK
ncbi:MAG: hypothetical protein KME64_05895 [Scytonematopsis contorta HA4267-MV1]|nr:hypothetical protein [Scytonematopsis contorta HA4267-MV1]